MGIHYMLFLHGAHSLLQAWLQITETLLQNIAQLNGKASERRSIYI